MRPTAKKARKAQCARRVQLLSAELVALRDAGLVVVAKLRDRDKLVRIVSRATKKRAEMWLGTGIGRCGGERFEGMEGLRRVLGLAEPIIEEPLHPNDEGTRGVMEIGGSDS